MSENQCIGSVKRTSFLNGSIQNINLTHNTTTLTKVAVGLDCYKITVLAM